MERETLRNTPIERPEQGVFIALSTETKATTEVVESSDNVFDNTISGSVKVVEKSEQSETFKVFVYGTLRKGYHNHYYLANDCDYVGQARSVNKYSMTAEEHYYRSRRRVIPFVSKIPEVEITGEVYEISKHTLRILDYLECHPRWYKREETEFEIIDEGTESKKSEDGIDGQEKDRTTKHVVAWIYFNEETKGPIGVPSGDFSAEFPLPK